MTYAKPTSARLVDQRARRRATQALIEMHRNEYRDLYEWHRHNAAAEAQTLVGLAPQDHDPSEPPRLMPGVRRPGQDAIDRIDVARCRRCHSHHDAGHVCQNCGLDERAADALANERDDDELRADFRRDVSEAMWA